jgi:hypothetical protein
MNLTEDINDHLFNADEFLIPELISKRVKVRYVSPIENPMQKRLNLELITKTIHNDWHTTLKDIDELILFSPFPTDLIEQLISSSTRKIIVVDYLGLDFTNVEKSLIKSGIDYLIVKTSPSFDLFHKLLSSKKDELECSLADLGDGKLSWVDSNDIQEAIFNLIFEKERSKRTITLTGNVCYGLKKIELMIFEATSCTRIKYIKEEKNRISNVLNIYNGKTQEIDTTITKYIKNRELKNFFIWMKENVEKFIFIPDVLTKMRHPTKGLILKSKTIKLVKYNNVFKASDAMNWILDNFKFISSRSKARGNLISFFNNQNCVRKCCKKTLLIQSPKPKEYLMIATINTVN